jgi:transmembrane protein 216
MYIVKGYKFIYPPGSLSLELICLVVYVTFSYFRYYIGHLGNKSEKSSFLIFFMLFTFFPFFSQLYFLLLQTYVLKFEVVINVMGLLFLMVEFVVSIWAIIITSLSEKGL